MERDDDGRHVRWFDVERCYVYRPLNAYDERDRVVLERCRHPRMFDTGRNGPNEGAPTFDRWTVDLAAGKVLEERLDDRGQEFPRVDERLTGRRHRYGYSVGVTPDGTFDSALLKHDMAGGHTEVRYFGPRAGLGEFVFVPTSEDAADDG